MCSASILLPAAASLGNVTQEDAIGNLCLQLSLSLSRLQLHIYVIQLWLYICNLCVCVCVNTTYFAFLCLCVREAWAFLCDEKLVANHGKPSRLTGVFHSNIAATTRIPFHQCKLRFDVELLFVFFLFLLLSLLEGHVGSVIPGALCVRATIWIFFSSCWRRSDGDHNNKVRS